MKLRIWLPTLILPLALAGLTAAQSPAPTTKPPIAPRPQAAPLSAPTPKPTPAPAVAAAVPVPPATLATLTPLLTARANYRSQVLTLLQKNRANEIAIGKIETKALAAAGLDYHSSMLSADGKTFVPRQGLPPRQ